MDIEDLPQTFKAVYRILRTKGRFTFTITHPCFDSLHARWSTDSSGTIKREVYEYFKEGLWYSRNSNGMRGKIGAYHRTLSTYINALIQAGPTIEKVIEPESTQVEIEYIPRYAVIPIFLFMLARK